MQNIKCPECSHSFPLDEALTGQLESHLRIELETKLKKKTAEIDRQVLSLKERSNLIEEKSKQIEADVKYQVQIAKEKLSDKIRLEIETEQLENTDALNEELKEKRQQLSEAKDAELTLRKQQRELEDEKSSLELTVQRKIDEERKLIFAKAKEQAAEEHSLKLSEKENLLTAMKTQIDSLKQRLELGSQEAQGEALEQQLQNILQQNFPRDKFTEVRKGVKGADIIQTIYNTSGKICGTIIWELKNAKLFSNSWIGKLKKDQQDANADIAVLMTMTLPKEITHLGLHAGIWITDHKSAVGLASALRNGLIEVANQKIINQSKSGTKDLIYDYVTGREFAMHIKIIVTGFTVMQENLEAEKRAITRIWKKREKEIETILNNVSGMRGSIEGISQKTLPDVQMSLESIGDDKNV